MTGRAAQKAESIKLVALDVDGVMTDGTLFYRAMSEPETKPFNIKGITRDKMFQPFKQLGGAIQPTTASPYRFAFGPDCGSMANRT